jgi:hypothetical protein
MTTDTKPLVGLAVRVAAARRREEQAALLKRCGPSCSLQAWFAVLMSDDSL